MLTVFVLVIFVIAIVYVVKKVAKEVLLPPGVAAAFGAVRKILAK